MVHSRFPPHHALSKQEHGQLENAGHMSHPFPENASSLHRHAWCQLELTLAALLRGPGRAGPGGIRPAAAVHSRRGCRAGAGGDHPRPSAGPRGRRRRGQHLTDQVAAAGRQAADPGSRSCAGGTIGLVRRFGSAERARCCPGCAGPDDRHTAADRGGRIQPRSTVKARRGLVRGRARPLPCPACARPPSQEPDAGPRLPSDEAPNRSAADRVEPEFGAGEPSSNGAA